MKKITQKYFDLMISRGVTDFSDLDLTDIKAMGIDLLDAKFFNTVLKNVDFRQSKFKETVIGGSRITFKNCIMDNVIFRGCDLDYVGFLGCNLENSIFNYATLSFVSFEKCNLAGSVFDEAEIDNCYIEGGDIIHGIFHKYESKTICNLSVESN
jgi:uncharacterized protein YjbI with pentapeptide repeats